MQFNVASLLLTALSASVIKPAYALPQPGRQDNFTRDVDAQAVSLFGIKGADGSLTIDSSIATRDIEKRGATLVVLGITGTAAMAKVAEMGIEWAAGILASINE